MSDRDWLVPSIALTAALGLFAIALIPSYSGILPAIGLLPLWVLTAAILSGFYFVAAMMIAGVPSPVAHIRGFAAREWRAMLVFGFGIFLAGLNMTTFMWTKPLLNYLVPFWADPMLADIDRALFLGTDPWRLLTWLNSTPMAIFYHRGWFAMMILTLIAVLAARPSAEKSAAMTTYFLLWSVAGPVIHALLPAAGPIFYAQLGLGDRFAGLEAVSETGQVATYLWTTYAGEGFGPGAGISAMPSLHIATVAWMIIVTRAFLPKLIVPMALAGLLTFLLSIALGWHYAVDGVVGAAAALVFHRLLLAYYAGRTERRAPAMVAG
ncbi:MAG: phosphatase PAP2 family protein [Sphingomonas sp.]|nr:phosphatase PAP2 family protein [Sphingomonas sp.]